MQPEIKDKSLAVYKMAIPRVFVSSTCYDLRYIRENLKFFIKNMGFEPVLSEEGNVYYAVEKDVQEACLSEISNCQMFVLIIGGRFGSKFQKEPESIVNHEYRAAIKQKVPVFAMVEQQVNSEYRVFLKNKQNQKIDPAKIYYPGVDSIKIFEFMKEVQNNLENNALVPFENYSRLESYLKQQWAGLMFSFLTKKAESERVMDMLDTIKTMSNRIEFLSKQILSSVGKDIEKLNALLFEEVRLPFLLDCIEQVNLFKVSPYNIISYDSLQSFEKVLKKIGLILDKKISNKIVTFSIKDSNTISQAIESYRKDEIKYKETRSKMLKILEKYKMTPDEYLKAVEELE